ncbi:hypothetical protein JOL79_07010 [Microbispora sp. RL4-1S]|uniref:Uncharacterized protein n=1 Tax=Microbispora oryzae TaxID=2806554 RepID=A0A940WIR8_9ACTN|nr:hypothetical protein [Microbispora oryzae]MBP2703548.1 hypothetical protein [Microbispora oryzae]
MPATLTPEQTAAAIDARLPTCLVPPPSILIEGGDKSGKSWLCAELTASPLVGDSYWLDLGEGAGDEYGDAIKGEITYKLLRHDGTWHAIMQRAREVHTHAAAVAAAGGKPVVLTVDSGSIMWEMLKTWADVRARSSKKNRARLEADPNAEITIPPNVWGDVHQRHMEFLKMLITFEGILLITARGRETVKVDKAGSPVAGEADYKVETQRDIPFAVTAHIRMFRDDAPMIMGCRSKHLRIGPKFDKPRQVPGFTLEQFIFQGLRFDPQATARRDYVEPGRERTPEQVRDDAIEAHHAHDREKLLALLAESGHPALATTTIINETGGEERLTDLIVRLGRSLDAPPPQQVPQQRQAPQQQPRNRFARERENRAAQAVPPAPETAGSSPDEPAPAELLDRMRAALAACSTTSEPAQIAAAAALTGRQIKVLPELTRREANRIGALALRASTAENPRQALAATLAQAMKNRKAA